MNVFPVLPGLTYSCFKRPTFSTTIAEHESGREVRLIKWIYPLWEFELNFEFLRDTAPLPELKTLAGFFLQAYGQANAWLFTDPDDCTTALQQIGIGDGTTVTFTALRSFGGFVEPVGAINGTPQVYVNGTLTTTGWSVQNNNQIVFTTAPTAGATIAASFSYYFICRFLADMHEYEKFMAGLWLNKSVKFRSVRGS